MILRLRIAFAEAEAGQIVGFDMGHAIVRASDAGFVAAGFSLNIR